MEEQEVKEGEGIMKVDAQERQDDLDNVKTEDDSALLRKEIAWIGELPGMVWETVTEMLLADHCTDDLANLTKVSPLFRDLMFSKRVMFLFPQVLEIIGPKLENEERSSEEEKSSILTCRLVCKSWNKSVDNYIQASGKPEFFRDPPMYPGDPALKNARYKYFGIMAPQKLKQFLDHFGNSHQPDSGPQRNPFIGSTVALRNDSHYNYLVLRQPHQDGDNILTLLRKYGQYIRVMSLGVRPPTGNEFQDYLWLKEVLELTPNLTHLKVTQQYDDPKYADRHEVDSHFGETAYRNVPFEEYFRKRVFKELGPLPAEAIRRINNIIRQTLTQREQFEGHEHQYKLDEQMVDHIACLMGRSWRIHRRQEDASLVPGHLNEDGYWKAIAEEPLPVLKNLECLKLCNLSAKLFNPLIQFYRQISWLHIDPTISMRIKAWDWDRDFTDNEMSSYVDWWNLDFPNLKKLHIKFPWSLEEVGQLRNMHPSFMKLTSLNLDYPCDGFGYMFWTDIFQVLEQNWSCTLTELKIRLPLPERRLRNIEIKNDCGDGRLALPKLKRLAVRKCECEPTDDENCIRNFRCWDSVKENLEEFLVFSY